MESLVLKLNDVIAVKELLKDEKQWTKGALARTFKDVIIHNVTSDPDSLYYSPVKWSLDGAFRKILGSKYIRTKKCLADVIEDVAPQITNIQLFNDHIKTTHTQIMDLLDKTIRYLTPNDTITSN